MGVVSAVRPRCVAAQTSASGKTIVGQFQFSIPACGDQERKPTARRLALINLLLSGIKNLRMASKTCFNHGMNSRRTHLVRGKGWLCASTFGREQDGIFRHDLLPDCFRANTRFNADAVNTPMRVGARCHPEAKSQDLAERLDRQRLAGGFFVRWL